MQFKQILFISSFLRERSSAASRVVYYVVSRPYFENPLRFPHLKIGIPPFHSGYLKCLVLFVFLGVFDSAGDYYTDCRNDRYCQQHIPPTH